VADVDVDRRVESNTGVVVLVVVALEETLAERAGILDGAEPSRKLRSVLERLEVRF
jgi:hypothetical protein